MSNEIEIKPLSASELKGPEQHFNAYCEAELERRRNSGDSFNEALFQEAAELVQRKLRARQERGFS